MESITETLYTKNNSSQQGHRAQFFTILENGIRSYKDKCVQAKRNAVLLSTEIEREYKIAEAFPDSMPGLKRIPVEVTTGIASWDLHPSLENIMRDYGTGFAIVMTRLPGLSQRNISELTGIITQYGKKDPKVNNAIKILRSGDEEEIYDLLLKHHSDIDVGIESNIRGDIAEMFFKYFINASLSNTGLGKELKIFRNLEKNKSFLKYDNNKKAVFEKEYETDALLSYNKKEHLNTFLEAVQKNTSALIYRNENEDIIRIN